MLLLGSASEDPKSCKRLNLFAAPAPGPAAWGPRTGPTLPEWCCVFALGDRLAQHAEVPSCGFASGRVLLVDGVFCRTCHGA